MAGRSGFVAHASGMAGSRASIRRLALAAATLACLSVLQAQQTPPPPAQQIPRFRAEANLVRVDAYVTAGGQSVDDLRAGDFDVFEDGVRQKVETFDYVRKGQVITPRAPGEPERPGRLFVLLIDTYHLPWVDRERLERRERDAPSWQPEPFRFPLVLPPPIPDDEMFRDALREIVNQVVGDEDRVAVLTPDMWAASLTFMDRRAAVEELATRSLKAYVTGQRPPELNHFEACFPDGPNIEAGMRVRYRLYRTFTTLHELMGNLELVREERKAVLVVTRGWDPPPRIRNYWDPRSSMIGEDDTVCHAERLALADKDFDLWFRSIINDAKRANVAFYSVYAHPLVTYSRPGPDIDEDTRTYQRQWGDPQRSSNRLLVGEFPAILHDRMIWHDVLTQLAKDTNGRAILTTDQFDKGLKEISDTLASYYLLGYYSTNPKRDGSFRKISVNVKRKGVNVRARPGYRAVIPAEVEAAEAANRPDPVPPAITAALAPLARLRSDVAFRLAVTPEWDQAAAGWRLRVIGEIDSEQARREEWRRGWRAELTVTTGEGKSTGTAGVSLKAAQPAFDVTFPTTGVLAAGDYEVRAKAYGADEETVFEARTPIIVPAPVGSGNEVVLGRPLLSRRPNMPRSEFQPTADQRFTRREVLLIEVPVAGAVDAPSLHLVDRQGQALGAEIPATIAERNGDRIVTGTIVLSNVAPGDYVIEITASDKTPERKVYVAFRVVP
jgi:VWFA-related protein